MLRPLIPETNDIRTFNFLVWLISLERCGCYLKLAIIKLISRIDMLNISCAIALRRILQDLTD